MNGLTLDFQRTPPVLTLHGALDMANADDFGKALKEAMSTDPTLVIDFADLSFVDASGLHALLDVAATRNGHGPLVLVNARRVRWLLKLLGLEDISALDIRSER
jgi:anti-anti-sigma factor